MTDINIDDLAPCPYCGMDVVGEGMGHRRLSRPVLIDDRVEHECPLYLDLSLSVKVTKWPKKEKLDV